MQTAMQAASAEACSGPWSKPNDQETARSTGLQVDSTTGQVVRCAASRQVAKMAMERACCVQLHGVPCYSVCLC